MTDSNDRQKEILTQCLAEIRHLKKRLAASDDKIAVIGMGCRMPPAVMSPDSLWEKLLAQFDGTGEVPGHRFNVNSYYDPDPSSRGKMYSKRGGFLEDISSFDPLHFGINPREVPFLDPQHRLVLEVAWEAAVNAGLDPKSLKGSETGVFVGVTAFDYAELILRDLDLAQLDAYVSMGTPLNLASGRLAHLLGLSGPAISLDTACSSSLVALHLAMEQLRLGRIDMAFAGGVNLALAPETTVLLCQAKMLSQDGRCKTFDAAADGYGRGEGSGILLLKRYRDALRDGDPIWACLAGSAINQDGASSGLTVPNGAAQKRVMEAALRDAGVSANKIDYVEAHGTGTSLGDPIELKAIQEVYGKARNDPVFVGSIKTNVGHLEAAAGVAGVIKTILSLHHKTIAPHLHFKTPNPNVDWSRLNLKVPVEALSWEKEAAMAAVSAFGASGTNAHVILERAERSTVVRPALPKFQRKHYWYDNVNASSSLLGERVDSPLETLQFRSKIHVHSSSLIDEHRMYGHVVLPGMLWVQMGILALEHLGFFGFPFTVKNFVIRRPLVFSVTSSHEVALTVQREKEGGNFQVFVKEDEWIPQAEMAFSFAKLTSQESLDVVSLQSRCKERMGEAEFYGTVWPKNFYLGSPFRCFEQLFLGDGEMLAELRIPRDDSKTRIQPELLLVDAAVQSLIAVHGPVEGDDIVAGVGSERVEIFFVPQEGPVWCFTKLSQAPEGTRLIVGNMVLADKDGKVFAKLYGVSFGRANRKLFEGKTPVGTVKKQKSVDPGTDVLPGIVAAVSGREVNMLGMEAPLSSMIDSLMAAEIREMVHGETGILLPMNALLGGSSIADLKEMLGQESKAPSKGLTPSDMEKKAHLDEQIQPAKKRANWPPRRIFLTGATGFVGTYLLRDLLKTSDAMMVCLVRADNENLGKERIEKSLEKYGLSCDPHMHRIEVIVGDLSKPRFGLTEDAFDALTKSVDLVWHVGAEVNWVMGLDRLFAANVQATKEIIELSCRSLAKPLHFVSTVGVFASSENADKIITESIPLSQSGTLTVGYAQSKWIAENLVRRAMERGLSASIYRINTGGDSFTGKVNPVDYLTLLIKGCLAMQKAPDYPLFNVQAAPIDYVSLAMTKLSLQKDADATYHLVNPQAMKWQELVDALIESGHDLEKMDFEAWLDEAKSFGQSSKDFPLLGLVPFFQETFHKDGARLPLFSDTVACTKLDMPCPPLDSKLLSLWTENFYP